MDIDSRYQGLRSRFLERPDAYASLHAHILKDVVADALLR